MELIPHPEAAHQALLLPHACRRVRADTLASLCDNPVAPREGDLALAEVLQPGAHQLLSLANGHSHRLTRGETLLVTLGSPYAPLAHTGRLPQELGECDLLTASGVAGIEIARAARLAAPTRLRLYGLFGDAHGQRLNLADFALPAAAGNTRAARNLLVVSTARRTQASAAMLGLVAGLAAHAPVAAMKLTGEIDSDFSTRLAHAGATAVFDAADAGLAVTGGATAHTLLAAADQLLAHAADAGASVTVTRLAGGLAQREVRALLASPGFAARFDGVLLTAADALSARAGVRLLTGLGLPVLAVSGAITESPLAMREAEPLSCPLLTPAALLADAAHPRWLAAPAAARTALAA